VVKAVFNSTGHPLEIPDVVAGEGAHLVDSAGNRYLDLESGVWCTSIGHGNQRVNDVIRNQIGTLTHAGFCYSSPVVEAAAEAVLSVCGMEGGSAVFLCSGSEGIDYARQAVRGITKRNRPVTFHDAYLGSLSSARDRTDDWCIIDWEKCASCPDQNRSVDCDHLDEVPDDVSEFLFEPGSSSGQVRFAPVPFVRKVVDLVRGNGGKVITNEVTTGIGRTGSWFGYDHYGIRPDLIVIGKGIGNGYPVSVVVMNATTSRELEAAGFRYMQSHQNDPLGAAVTKEVISVIREDALIERAARIGPVFLAALQRLVTHPAVVDVRGRGLMYAVDLRDESTGGAVFRSLLERGFIVGHRGATLRMDPPLAIDEDEFLAFVDVFAEVVGTV
jgi:acetylornithine aminotransferase